MTKLLIQTDPADRPTSPDGSAMKGDPVFLVPSQTGLQLELSGLDEEIAEYLAHHVVRQPGDLRAHLQRIHFHLGRGEVENSCGALLDLFIVLGDKGRSLRELMLRKAEQQMDRPLLKELRKTLDQGLRAADPIPVTGASMLSKGLSGIRQLVMPEGSGSGGARDPLLDAREYLEYGQVDQARTTLEEAILMEPWRSELHDDLLEIYRYTRDRDGFLAMWERLEALNGITAAWIDLKQTLG